MDKLLKEFMKSLCDEIIDRTLTLPSYDDVFDRKTDEFFRDSGLAHTLSGAISDSEYETLRENTKNYLKQFFKTGFEYGADMVSMVLLEVEPYGKDRETS